MKKILTIGGGMYDIFTQYENVETLHLDTNEGQKSYVILQAGRKIDVQKLSYYCGGGATNSAVSFARAGFDVEAFFKVGTDQAGDFIIQTVQSENVATSHVIKTSNVETGRSFIIPGPHGNRSVLVYRGANLTLTVAEIPERAIVDCDQLYITSLSGPAAQLLIPIVQIAKKHNKSVAVNPGTSQLHAGPELLKRALSFIDVLILNSYEAQVLMTSLITSLPQMNVSHKERETLPQLLKGTMGSSTTCFTLSQFFHEIHSHGPRIVVVTNGAEGVYASDATNIYFHPSVETNIVSSIGAGDAFGSSFVGSLNRGTSVENALRAGIINSASVIEHLGTQTGLLAVDELERRCTMINISLLKKYPLDKKE
jgi:sugar/nucleoside kinase (ribokinase family)